MQEQPKIAETSAPKNWQWPHDQIFEISGKTLELFLHLKNSILSNPESQKVIMALQLDELLQKVVEDGIKSGKITDGSTPIEVPVANDQNHYSVLRSKDPETLSKILGMTFDKDLDKDGSSESLILDAGEPKWYDGYWIPESEVNILNNLRQSGVTKINFGWVNGVEKHKEKSYNFWYVTE